MIHTPATTRLRPAADADVLAVAWLLARAFHADPVTRWLVPDPARHTPVMDAFFEVLARDALTAGAIDLVVDTDDQPVAAAIWYDRTAPCQVIGAPTVPDPRLDRIFGPDASRWHALDAVMSDRHPADRHWYLFAVGVRPDLQGQGLGSRLLHVAHERIGSQATYLEATTTVSRRLYLRHGYILLGNPLHLSDGPELWPMWRPAPTTVS